MFALVNCWQIPTSPDHPARPFDTLALIKHFLLLDVSLNTTLWALQVEVLMAPIIVSLYFAERRYGIRPILAFAIAATALSFSKQWALWPPLSHYLFAFVVGTLIPTLGRDLVTRLSPTLASRTLAGAALLMFLPTPLFGFYSQFSAVTETYAAAVLLGLIAYRTDLRGCYWLEFLARAPARPFVRQLLRASHGDIFDGRDDRVCVNPHGLEPGRADRGRRSCVDDLACRDSAACDG